MDYRTLFDKCGYSLNRLLQQWAQLGDDELPTSLHRGRQRAKETLDEWRDRGAAILMANPPKKPGGSGKDYVHHDRFAETLVNVRDAFDLSDDEIERFGKVIPDGPDNFCTETEIRQVKQDTYSRHGLERLRATMWGWVTASYDYKRSEAVCDLDCFNCESAMIMNCAAQNTGSAELDGHDLSEVTNPGEGTWN